MTELQHIANLINERNKLEERISAVTGRPASIGHLGEYIASKIFGIRLAENANHKGVDGWIDNGPLKDRSVNIKWYAKHESILDMCREAGPDYYLVLAGPKQAPTRAIGPRPCLIESVDLFEETSLRGVVTAKIGIATSVRREVWEQHQIYPVQTSAILVLTEEQRVLLRAFGRRE